MEESSTTPGALSISYSNRESEKKILEKIKTPRLSNENVFRGMHGVIREFCGVRRSCSIAYGYYSSNV